MDMRGNHDMEFPKIGRSVSVVRKSWKEQPNHPVHGTTVRWRFLLNVKGYGGAAARDGGR